MPRAGVPAQSCGAALTSATFGEVKIFFETAKQDHGLPHNPFKSLVVPRPIGWISSVDRAGIVNLAPYSFFNAIGSNPPLVMFASEGGRGEDQRKDTQRNTEETGEFVCNLATWDLREAMNATSAPLPSDVDEFAAAGLTPIPSKLVKPPRVAESPVQMECRTVQSLRLPSNQRNHPQTLVIGQVLGIHIDEAYIRDGRVDVARLKPIARLGYMDYTVVETIFTMQRPE